MSLSDETNLTGRTANLKNDADQVISDTRILPLMEALGKVFFVGSYSLNLLYRPDIDLYIQSEDCSRNQAVELTKSLLDSNEFQTIGFADCTTHKRDDYAVLGFYWELIYFSPKYKWKFDIWYTSEKVIDAITTTNKIAEKLKINPEARQQILQLKEKYYDGVKYRDGLNGRKIYEQVLGPL